MTIATALVTKYAEAFLGYGNTRNDWWFVGLQEGIHDSAEFERRIRQWEKRGCRALENLTAFHEAFCSLERYKKLFALDGTNATQDTWRGLIRVYLTAHQRGDGAIELEAIRKFQATELSDKALLLELYPFPAKRIAETEILLRPYFSAESIPSRLETWRDVRAEKIASLIKQHKPKIVVFYGKTALAQWRTVVGDSDLAAGEPSRRKGGGWVIVMPHPVSREATNNCLDRIGRELRGL